MSDPLARLDATAQAELVRRGELSPEELVEAGIRRLESLEPALGAFVHRSLELAKERGADPPEGPFRGVPFALKDIGGPEAGQPQHAGMAALKAAGWTEPADGYLTQRFKRGGLVTLGRTNTPELALLPTTEPEAYGPTRNPWNPEHSAGGSSGGAAAAVAAGIVPAAHASDGGGSIRGPAAMCGLVGLKPTRARNSFGPGVGERWSGLSAEFVVTRSVRDSAALLGVTAGSMPGDPYHAPPGPDSWAGCHTAAPGALRIGFLASAFRNIEVDPCLRAAVRDTAVALEELGHHVEEAHPEALEDARHVIEYVKVVSANVARALQSWGGKIGRVLGSEDVEPLTGLLAEQGRNLSAPELLETIEYVHGFGRRLAAWWQDGFDLLLTPTQAMLPPPLGYLTSTAEEPLRAFLRAGPYGCFTLPFNLSGQPGISVPAGLSDEGNLPLGVQLVAAQGREDLLLKVAAQLEVARPWADRVPAVHA